MRPVSVPNRATPDPPVRRTPPIAQPAPPSWSAGLAPSQQRAARRREHHIRQRSAQDWLRTLAERAHR